MKGKKSVAGPPSHVKKGKGRLTPLAAFVSMAAGFQSATQVFAHTFDYQAALGPNFLCLYTPWSIAQWFHAWYDKYPEQLVASVSVGILVASAGLLASLVWRIISSNTSVPSEFMHGSARWAGIKDIKTAGLLFDNGSTKPPFVYVGAWRDRSGKLHYLRHSGPEHVLTYAPTRSGKGVGLVVPTLLAWPKSCVVTDLKGELWAMTAGWRKNHANNTVLRFEPASAEGCVKWNPLEEVRLGTEYEVADVQNLAHLIVDPDGKGLVSHWQKTSFALLVGVILHALYKARNEGAPTATLPGVDLMLSDPERPVDDLWREMSSCCHAEGVNHPAVGSAARDQMDRPEEEAGSVLSTAKSYLSLYRDPVVARNVSSSEFKIRDLMHREKPVSLYIVTQPNDKSRLRPLVRIMIVMIFRILADKIEFVDGKSKAHYKHRLLMMLDEFPALGKLEIFQEALAFVAGYGIKCYLICQDLNQLKSRDIGYGPDETVTSNCHVQNAYPPNRIETAEHLSRLTGQTTIVKESITTSGNRIAMMLGRVSKTHSEVQRPLLTPDECIRMPGPLKNENDEIVKPGAMIVYVAGYPAIYGEQPLFFQDPTFLARSKVPPPAASDILIALPVHPDNEDIENCVTTVTL